MMFVERSYKVIVLFRDKPLATSFVVDPHCCTLLEHDTVGCIGWGRGAGTSTSLELKITRGGDFRPVEIDTVLPHPTNQKSH